VSYGVEGSAAVVTITRPHRYNAFTGRTVEDFIRAFR
jgi:1,4-dihydroxy-2-naphthoyl-CoA synthase